MYKLGNNQVKKKGLNNHIIHSKNVLFDAHGLKLQHLVTLYENNASSMNFVKNSHTHTHTQVIIIGSRTCSQNIKGF